MDFINKEYRKDHILSNNKSLFKYEFGNGADLNFILAKDEKGNIIGCIGYIKSNSLDKPDLWTSVWSVSKKSSDSTLGIKLFLYLREKIPHRYLLAPGVNQNTLLFYEKFGIKTGTLKQHYIINDSINNYNIARVIIKDKLFNTKIDVKKKKKIISVSNIVELKKKFALERNIIPFKDFNFIQKRYFTNPYQKYNLCCVLDNEKYSSLFVTREVAVNKSKALLLVDFIGNHNDLFYISNYLYDIIIDKKFEYVTFLEHGISEEIINNSKFVELNHQNDRIIIPIYFSPFVQKNVEIIYFADNIEKNYYIFKADGDQDRPN